MYFWLSLLAIAALGNGHRWVQRWQREHRTSKVSLHGFGSIDVREIFRLQPLETSGDPDKLTFTFSYDNYTDWGGNSRCSGYMYLDFCRPGSPQPFDIRFDGDKRLLSEMAGSLVIQEQRLEQHFKNIPVRAEPKPVPETLVLFHTSIGWVGYRNQDGREVLPPHYPMGSEFREGLALVQHGGHFGAIDRNGKFQWQKPAEALESLGAYHEGKAKVRFGQWEEIRSGPHGLEREDMYVTSERWVDRAGNYLD